MAESKLKVTIAGDASQLEKVFHEVKEKAKELGHQVGEVGTDLSKSLTGLDIGKLLGIGGAVYAATKLGDALIDAAKEGYKAFQVYQDAVLKFKYNAPSSAGTLEERGKLGEEMAETAESKVGIFSFTQLSNAGIALEQVANELKLSPEKINGLVDTMQALAIKSGTTPDVIAENFRKLVVSIKEEGSGAVGKFFKATPGLEEEAGKLRDAHAAAYLQSQGANASGAAQQAEYAKLLLTPIAEFMTQESQRVGGRGILEEVQGVMERSAPKSITTEEQDIHPEAALNAEMEKLSKAFGEDLAPAVREITKGITEAIPTLRDDFKEIGDVLKLAVIPAMELFGSYLQAIGGQMNMVGNVLGNVLTKLFPFSGQTDASKSVNAKLDEMGLSSDSPMLKGDFKQPEQAPRGYAPYGASKEYLPPTKIEAAGSFSMNEGEDPILAAQKALSLKTQTDVDAINLKAANEHIASQRARDFEAASTGYLNQSKEAAQSALSRINPADPNASDKGFVQTQENEAKAIAIKEAAAQKGRAADEASAVKIAKIQEEIDLRDIQRKADAAKDQTKALEAAEIERNARDIAADAQKSDLLDDAAQKRRDADADAARSIIDMQAASAQKVMADVASNITTIAGLRERIASGGPQEMSDWDRSFKQVSHGSSGLGLGAEAAGYHELGGEVFSKSGKDVGSYDYFIKNLGAFEKKAEQDKADEKQIQQLEKANASLETSKNALVTLVGIFGQS